MIKIHPPHQLLYPNDYLSGVKELEIIYRAAEANGVPVMFHTGTSVFPGARNKYGDPIHVDDVAVDFPKLKILLAHGGRPLWMDTAFFLVRRHPNVPALAHEIRGIKTLVTAHRHTSASRNVLHHFQRRIALRHACGFPHPAVHKSAVGFPGSSGGGELFLFLG